MIEIHYVRCHLRNARNVRFYHVIDIERNLAVCQTKMRRFLVHLLSTLREKIHHAFHFGVSVRVVFELRIHHNQVQINFRVIFLRYE